MAGQRRRRVIWPIGGSPLPRCGRRRGWSLLVAGLLLASVPAAAAPGAHPDPGEGEELVAVEVARLPPPPLFLAIAQVIVPPGAVTDGGDTAGPRLLLVKSGTLTVVAGGGAAGLGRGGAAGSELVLAAGDRLGLPERGIGGLRNDGTRAVVFLDAALFPAADRPAAAAFTTDDGISVQVLAAAVVEAAPPGPALFRLRRLRLAAGEALPAGPWPGLALARVEAGSLRLVPAAEGVQFSRAAAAAPYSAAGPMRPLPAGAPALLSAGASVLLPPGAAVASENERAVAATLLLLEVVPAGGAGRGPAVGPAR